MKKKYTDQLLKKNGDFDVVNIDTKILRKKIRENLEKKIIPISLSDNSRKKWLWHGLEFSISGCGKDSIIISDSNITLRESEETYYGRINNKFLLAAILNTLENIH